MAIYPVGSDDDERALRFKELMIRYENKRAKVPRLTRDFHLISVNNANLTLPTAARPMSELSFFMRRRLADHHLDHHHWPQGGQHIARSARYA